MGKRKRRLSSIARTRLPPLTGFGEVSFILQCIDDALEPRRKDHIVNSDEDLIDISDYLYREFESSSERDIEAALQELPHRVYVAKGHPRLRTGGTRPRKVLFGSAKEAAARAELMARLEELDAAIREYRSAYGPIGHNRPSETIKLDPGSPPSPQALEGPVAALRNELALAAPDIGSVRRAANRIGLWAKAWKWFKGKADRSVNSFVDQTGTMAAIALAATLFSCGDKAAGCATATHSAANAWVDAATVEDIPSKGPVPTNHVTTARIRSKTKGPPK